MGKVLILSALLLCQLICTVTATESTNKKHHISIPISLLEHNERPNYQPVTDIGNDINKLDEQLKQDQLDDNERYQADKLRIETAIKVEQDEIAKDKVERQTFKDQLTAFQQERATIEDIYQKDRAAYLDRQVKQQRLLDTLQKLAQNTQEYLIDNKNVPEAGQSVQSIFTEIRQLGHGHNLQALAQMMKLFTKTDARDILGKFNNLQDAVVASQSIDQQKEDHNLNLYNLLSEEIDNVFIPKAEESISQINSDIKRRRKTISDLNDELSRITKIYLFRYKERSHAIEYTKEAETDLNNELEQLVKAEIVVRQK